MLKFSSTVWQNMEEINAKAMEAKEEAVIKREEMERLLGAANEEREHTYGDARTMAKERDTRLSIS